MAMTDLDAIEKRAREGEVVATSAYGSYILLTTDDVLALVEEVRLARAWLAAWQVHWDAMDGDGGLDESEAEDLADAARNAYRAFLAKREAP